MTLIVGILARATPALSKTRAVPVGSERHPHFFGPRARIHSRHPLGAPSTLLVC
jgi:hypothetical protein